MNLLKRVASLIPKKATREERTIFTEIAKAIDGSSSTDAANQNTSNKAVYRVLKEAGIPVTTEGALIVENPETPTGFVASASFTTVVLSWSAATYQGHDYAEIYRHTTDDLAQAQANGVWKRAYNTAIGDNVDAGSTHHYWIRFINKAGVAGGFFSANGTEAITAVPYEQMLSSIEGLVDAQHLATSLATPIGKIPTIESNLNTAMADIGTAQTDIIGINAELATLPPLINAAQSTANANAQALLESNALYSQEIADARSIAENNSSDLVNSVISLSQAYSDEAAARRQSVGEVQQYLNAIIQTNAETGEITLDAIASFQSEYDSKLSVVNQRLSAAEGKFDIKVWQTDVDAKGNEVLSAVDTEFLSRAGVCSNPDYIDAGSCLLNGGTWTLSSLAQEKKSLIASINTAETSAKAYADTQTQAVATDLAAEVTRVDTLLTDFGTAQSDISNIQTAVSSIEGENYTLQINNATSRITQNESDISGAQDDIANIVTTTYTKAETDSVVAESSSALRTELQGDIAAVEQNAYTKSEVDQTVAGVTETISATNKTAEQASLSAAESIIQNALTGSEKSQQIRETNADVIRKTEALTEADNALATSIQQLTVSVDENAASIYSEQTARADADSAMATDITALQASVSDNAASILSEQSVRATADSAIALEITQLQSDVSDNHASILSEATARASADSALATDISALQVTAAGNAAAIQSEQTARANADTALASDISTLQTTTASNTASIQAETTARTTADSALAGDISTLQVSVGSNAAAIQSEATTRATETTALANNIATLQASTGENAAAIQAEQTARTSADSALAADITTVQTTLEGQIGSVQTTAEAAATTANGIVVKYGVKLDVNGYVTGFQQNNNGSTGSLFIRADQFGVIDPASTTNYADMTAQQLADALPFIISNGSTYIKNAYIKDLESTNIKAGSITADRLDTTYIAVGSAASDVNGGGTTINGGKITAGSITADRLDTSYISVGSAASDINSGTTTIDGGKISANTVTASEIDVTDLFAQNITATGSISGITLTGANVTASVLQDSTYNLGAQIVKYKLVQILQPPNIVDPHYQSVIIGNYASGGITNVSAMYGVGEVGSNGMAYIRLKDLSSHHGYWWTRYWANGDIEVVFDRNDIYEFKMQPNGLTSMYVYVAVHTNSANTHGVAPP